MMAAPEDGLNILQVRRQKDLKVIVMSATLDAAKFADFFRAGKIVHIVVQIPSSASSPMRASLGNAHPGRHNV